MRSAGIARPVGERTPGTGGAGLSGPAVRRGGGAFGAEPGTRLSRRVRGLTAGAGAHVSRGDGAVPGTARLRRCRVPPARPAQPAVSAGRAYLSAPGHESVSGSPPGDQGDRGRGLARDRAARAARPVQGPGARELARGRDGDAGARGRDAGRSEEHTSELQSRSDLVCRLLLEKKKKKKTRKLLRVSQDSARV